MKESEADFSKIFLLRKEEKLLWEIATEGMIGEPADYAIYALVRLGLVRNINKHDPIWNLYDRDLYVITDRGQRYCEYLKQKRRDFWRPIVFAIFLTVAAAIFRATTL